jgi:catechol 2,3-dioxygenase
VSEALYLRDPEGNGVEIYRDRPRDAWSTTADGHVDMQTLSLDLDSLANDGTGEAQAPRETDIGHVHLEVTNLARSEAFYVDVLGFGVRARYGADASFLAAGDYHHHLGLNTWNTRDAPRSSESCGLDWFEVVLPEGFPGLKERLTSAGQPLTHEGEAIHLADPDGIGLRLLPEPSDRDGS